MRKFATILSLTMENEIGNNRIIFPQVTYIPQIITHIIPLIIIACYCRTACQRRGILGDREHLGTDYGRDHFHPASKLAGMQWSFFIDTHGRSPRHFNTQASPDLKLGVV